MPIACSGCGLFGVQRLEHCVLCQELTAVGAKACKVQEMPSFGQICEGFKNCSQQPILGTRCCRPIDQRQCLQSLERFAQPFGTQHVGHIRLAKHEGRRSVQRIEKQARGRRVWTEARRIGAEHRVQRTERQRIRASRTGRLGECRDTCGVADATIATVAQGIDLRCNAPQPCIRNCIIDRAAAAWCHCENKLAVIDQQPMIASLTDRGHPQPSSHGRDGKIARAACFEAEPRVAHFVRGDIKPCRPAGDSGDQRRQRLHRGATVQQIATDDQIAACAVGQANGRKDVAQHLGRDSLRPARDIMPLNGDAGALCEIAYCLVSH